MRPNYKDIKYVNAKYGKLTVRGVDLNCPKRTYWICKCDCGKTITVSASKVARGVVSSCGCAVEHNRHNLSRDENGQLTALYKCWLAMRSKCNNYFDRTYHMYGAVGITYCEAWEDYRKFHNWAVEHGYDPKNPGTVHLRRHDEKKDFSPRNCYLHQDNPRQ